MPETIQLEVPVIVHVSDDHHARRRAELVRAVAAGEPASSVIIKQRSVKTSLWNAQSSLQTTIVSPF